MSPRSRHTDAQIAEVLRIYSTVSTTAAYAVGAGYGMRPSRIRRFASDRGVKAKFGENSRWQPSRDIQNDPRWARARAVGPVIA